MHWKTEDKGSACACGAPAAARYLRPLASALGKVVTVAALVGGCSGSDDTTTDENAGPSANAGGTAGTTPSEGGGQAPANSHDGGSDNAGPSANAGGTAGVTPSEEAGAPANAGGAAPATPSEDAPCPALESYALSDEFSLQEIPAEGSGITWNWETETFLVVANLVGAIWEYDRDLVTLLRPLALTGMDMDTEGLEYLGGGRLAIAAENNEVYVTSLRPATTELSGLPDRALVFQPSGPPPVANAGFEGVAYRQPHDDAPGRFFVCQEHQPMRVLQFDDVADPGLVGTRSASDGSLEVQEPWDAETTLSGDVSDIAGMVYNESRAALLIVSQESSVVIEVDPDNGTVTGRLPLVDTSTSEGVTLFDGCLLAVMSEPDRVQVYAPQDE